MSGKRVAVPWMNLENLCTSVSRPAVKVELGTGRGRNAWRRYCLEVSFFGRKDRDSYQGIKAW